jgi:hypothetical protein
VPAFVIKGDVPYIQNGRHAAFMIKGDAPLVIRVSLYLHNQRCTIGMRLSLLSQKRVSLGY